MFAVVNLRKWLPYVLTVLLMAATVLGISLPIALSAAVPAAKYTIVIDAGHGGMDGGVVGYSTKTPEAKVNLAIAKYLQKDFEKAGIKVVLTRSGDGGLYPLDSRTPKKDDMKARAAIINSTKPNLMISIHQNAFPLRSERGAQVFYRKGSEESKLAAELMQQQLNRALPSSDRQPQVGDFYVLNCNDYPAVLVECGFLSNAEDEKNLLDEQYRQKVAYQIYIGAVSALASIHS